MKIKEIIVVEGRDDETAIKRSVDAHIIITHGFHISKKTLELIKKAQKEVGVIILTDPDRAGENIRKSINAVVPGCKQAYISREEGTLNGNIGVENASDEAIQRALLNAHATDNKAEDLYTKDDLLLFDLIGSNQSSYRRSELGKMLSIGYANGSTFLKRLNSYQIDRELFLECIEKLEDYER